MSTKTKPAPKPEQPKNETPADREYRELVRLLHANLSAFAGLGAKR